MKKVSLRHWATSSVQ